MSPTRDVIGGSDTDVLADALSHAIAGRVSPAAFEALLVGTPGADGFVERTLRRALTRQDWDAVDILLPICVAHPDQRNEQVLNDILDRQHLKISGRVLAEAAAASAAARPDASQAVEARPHHREEQL